MKRLLTFLLVIASIVALNSCKTTEANYRKAYQIAKEKQTDGGDSTVTADLRGSFIPKQMVIGGVTLPVRTEPVILTPAENADPTAFKVYNVVAGSFKQLFNARSLRDRLRELGFNAFLIHNRDRNYYIVAASTQDPAEAAAQLERLRKTEGVYFQPNFPYVLRASQLVR